MVITDPQLTAILQTLTPFERRCLERYLRGVGDDYGRQVFFRIKSQLKRRARARRAGKR